MRRAISGLSLRLALPDRVRLFRQLQRTQWLPVERLTVFQDATLAMTAARDDLLSAAVTPARRLHYTADAWSHRFGGMVA